MRREKRRPRAAESWRRREFDVEQARGARVLCWSRWRQAAMQAKWKWEVDSRQEPLAKSLDFLVLELVPELGLAPELGPVLARVRECPREEVAASELGLGQRAVDDVLKSRVIA